MRLPLIYNMCTLQLYLARFTDFDFMEESVLVVVLNDCMTPAHFSSAE